MLGDATESPSTSGVQQGDWRAEWRVGVGMDLGWGAKPFCFSRARLWGSLLSRAVQGIPFWPRSFCTSPRSTQVLPRLN